MKRQGRCYELAGKAMLKREGWKLAHGTVRGREGERIGHAWLERDDMVYDAVLDREIDELSYLARFHAERQAIYSQEEAAVTMLQHKHWGPWHE